MSENLLRLRGRELRMDGLDVSVTFIEERSQLKREPIENFDVF